MDVIDKIKLKGDEYKDLAKATQENRRKCAQSMQRQCKNLAKTAQTACEDCARWLEETRYLMDKILWEL